MPTVREIAELAGVSISTVSLALNNKQGVSDATRQRVLQAAEELRKEELVHSHAAPASSGQPLSVLVLHPEEVGDEVFSQSLQGIRAGVSNHGVQLQFIINEPDRVKSNLVQLFFSDPQLLPDGVLVLGARKDEPLVNKALEMGIPCVLSQRETPDPRLSSAGVDEAEIADKATRHLLDLGHRAIAFVGGRPNYSYTDGRIRGYRQTLTDHGITVPERWISLGWDRTAMEAVLEHSPEVTAVVFIDDGYARDYGLPVIEDAGLAIPDDLSVVSFDDIQEMQDYTPPITSAAYPFYRISMRAIQVLEELIQDPLLSSLHIRFHATLIKRASCAPPRGVDAPPSDAQAVQG
jgi:DNA-binding LacI/PurR family transcriptional regulator